MSTKPQFLISAPSSNSGKTTLTQALLRIFKNKGLKPQAFKCGPDYIDTKHHAWASGNVSINLDTFMSSKTHVSNLYHNYLANADISVVEGVMGLFDGAKKMQGSSAEIAELLDITVVLVVNAKAQAYSVAALLYGYKNFYPGIKIAGVIFNFVSGESHYQFLKDACDDVGITPLGYIVKNDEIQLPSRHLGLQISDKDNYEELIEKMAEHVSKTVDVDLLLRICAKSFGYKAIEEQNKHNKIKIAVAKDEAFNFTYHENLKAFQKKGEILYFSPINDKEVPDADFLYLAGGYPELYLEQLSKNESMKNSILAFAKNGGKILAECGGMMYLCNKIVDKECVEFPMVGFLNQTASMQDMKLHLGYRKVRIDDFELRGHEFHYSHLNHPDEKYHIGNVFSARDSKIDTLVLKKENTIASYIHFYGGEKDLLKALFDLV